MANGSPSPPALPARNVISISRPMAGPATGSGWTHALAGPTSRTGRRTANPVFLFQRGRLPLHLEPGLQPRLQSCHRNAPRDPSLAQRQAVCHEHLTARKDVRRSRRPHLPQSRRKLCGHLDEFAPRQIEQRTGFSRPGYSRPDPTLCLRRRPGGKGHRRRHAALQAVLAASILLLFSILGL